MNIDYPLFNVKTRQKEMLDDDLVNDAILGGTHSFPADATVPVVDRDGRRAHIGAGEVRAAIKEGFRVIGPKELAVSEYLKENDNLAGAAKVFFGQALDEFALGVPELIADYTEDPFEVAKREGIKKQHALANTLGGVTGFIGSALWGPARVGTIGAQSVSGVAKKAIAARLNGTKAAEKLAGGMLQRLGGKTIDGVAEGALLSLPHAITESAFGDHEAAAESMLFGTLAGGVFGGGVGLAGELLDASRAGASRFYSWAEGKPLTGAEVSQKFARIVTGVPEEHIAHLADDANLERMIRRKPEGGYDVIIPERENIADEAEAVLNHIQENKRLADESYTRILSDTTAAFNRELDDIGRSSAPEGVIRQVTDYLDKMKASAGDLRVRFDDTLKEIEQFIIPAADPETIKRIPFYIPKASITKMLNALEDGLTLESATMGATGLTASPGKIKAIQRLSQVRSTMDEYFKMVKDTVGKEQQPGMDMLFARNVVRDLDDIADYGLNAGEFDSAVSGAIKGAQAELREAIRLKLSQLQERDLTRLLDPVTAETVKQLSRQAEELWNLQIKNARVLSEAGKHFQNPIRTANALDAMSGKNFRASEIAKALEAVEREVGEPILPMLDDWMRRKDLYRKAKLSPKDKAEVLAELLPTPAQVLEQARIRAETAGEELLPFKGWSRRRIENIVNKVEWKNASTGDMKTLEELSRLRDKYFQTPDALDYQPRNFFQEAKDRAVWDSFDQARVNGSRKALMGAALGGSVFAPVGAPEVGAAIGAGLGGAVDYYGGKMLRDFLINGNNYRGLLFVEAQMKKAAKKLDGITGAVESFSKRDQGRVARIARTGGIQAILGLKGDFSDRREHWEKIQEKVAALGSDPDAMIRITSELAGGLSKNGAASIGAKFNQKLMKSIDYIMREMPKPPRGPSPFAPKTNWRPTDYELKLFDDKLEVLSDPFSVIDRMKDRTISRGHVSALRENYPRIYEEIKWRTAERLMETKVPVERGDRIKLSLLFDANWDSGLSDAGILSSQAIYNPKNAGAGVEGGEKLNVNIAGNYASRSDQRQMLDA